MSAAAAAAMNGSTPAASRNSSSAQPSSNTKQQLKTNASGKALDGPRKQAGSPLDASSAKKPVQKAWQGTNPITQRPNSTNNTNGSSNGSTKISSAPSKGLQQLSPQRNTTNRHAHDRILFLLANFPGTNCRVTLRNGERFEGIFSGASVEPSDARFTMKMVKRVSAATQSNGAAEKLNEYIGNGEDYMVAFDLQDTIDLNVWDVQLSAAEDKAQNGIGPTFRTDAEISGAANIRERELQPWQPGPDTEVDLSLGESSIGGWDQFAANEQLYNVRSDYDENLYTTSINRSASNYKQIEANAARLANEINRSEPVNSHVAEERRMNAKPDAGLDEEDKYSGVRRDVTPLDQGRPNAYVPPSRRPITGQPTVQGAPFDPAIISSQLARPSVGTANNSDSQAALAKQQSQKSPDTDEASRAVAAAQLTTETSTQTASSPSAPTITVAAAGQPAALSRQISPAAQRKPGEGGTEGVERKVLDSFKQFANTEKLKLQQHQRGVQERQRASARQEKSVKLNDLKKFAENFKLYSRVPDDLVPILAKTKEKQEEIVSKAEQQARDKELKPKTIPTPPATTPSKPETEAPDSKSVRAAPFASRPDASTDPSSPFNQRQRTSQNFRAPNQNQPISSPRGPSMMNHRVPANPAQQRASMVVPGPIPLPELRIAPNAPSQMRESGLVSPSSAASTRFNVKAMEFRPNPGASTFTPGGAKVSPQESKRPSVSATTTSPPEFFPKDVQPPSERTPFASAFNPIKRMADKAQEENKTKDFAANGGIPQAYRTPPTWDCPEANINKSYEDMFQKSLAATISPLHTPSNGGMPHQHQLPLHLQNGPPQMPSAQQTPRFYPAQPHHVPNQHLEEQRMQYASSNSSVQPSPRMGHPAMAYNAQMHPQMQGFPAGMPPYMSPAMQMRPMPTAPQFGPQGPQMGGQMMMQQPSNGPYMGPMGQQMPMYPSPAPGHVQPHFGHPQQPGAGGPYAPNPRGHPMSHQGSQQGHAAGPMYMMGGPPGAPMMMQHPGQMAPMRGFVQPQFQGGPHGYPMQNRQMSGGGFNHQMTPRQHHAAPQQGPSPGNAPPMHNAGDEGK